MSGVWEHFTKCPDDKNHAICNYCQSKLNRRGGCTTVMWSHLKSQHKSVQVTKNTTPPPPLPGLPPPTPRPVQLQPNIKSSLAKAGQPKKTMSKSQQEDLRRSAAWMCAVDVRPLSMVNGRGFRNFCKKLNPMFVVPDRHVVASYIRKIYLEGHAELKADIKGCGGVGLTTDGWTSAANEGYLTLTAQYINSAWIQKTKVLGTRVLKSRHTGDKVSDAIHQLLTEYEIKSVMGIATDNASNMKAACQAGGLPRIPCFSHTLQLAVQDGLRLGKKPAEANNGTIQKAIGRAKKLVTFFNHSTPGKQLSIEFKTLHICEF